MWVSYLNFIFPVGIFLPFIADLYILSRMLKGHWNAYWTGEKFELEDELFSLQRTFALLEAQTESVPFKKNYIKQTKCDFNTKSKRFISSKSTLVNSQQAEKQAGSSYETTGVRPDTVTVIISFKAFLWCQL